MLVLRVCPLAVRPLARRVVLHAVRGDHRVCRPAVLLEAVLFGRPVARLLTVLFGRPVVLVRGRYAAAVALLLLEVPVVCSSSR